MSIVAKISMVLATLVLSVGAAFAQNRSINGTVVDGQNIPVIGASVIVVGNGTIGTVTDLDGNFALTVPQGASVEVSCIGYKSQVLSTADQTTFKVVLVEDSEFLEETVVIGYGVQKKSDLTGSVASVRADDLKALSTADAGAALQGKAAGVQVLNSSGAPGTGAQIRVRGYSSNSSSSSSLGPLLIVDGLKVDNIQYLDPSMIESMEVLKDAASAAIYGAEAGNGVVLITTKTGSKGHSSITYDGRLTIQSLAKKAELFTSQEYADYQMAIGNLSQDFINAHWDGKDHNWFDAVFAPSLAQQHGLTFQGGNDRGHFFLSLNYLDNDGIVKGKADTYKRLTAQINADYKIKEWFNISTSNSIEKWDTKSVSQASYGSMLNSVVSLDPLTPAFVSSLDKIPDSSRTLYNLGSRNPEEGLYAVSWFLEEATGNPLFQRDKSDATNGGLSIRGNIAANLSPVKSVVFTSRFGYRIAQSSSHSFTEPYWLSGMCLANDYSIGASVNTSLYYQWENFINFNKTIGKHAIGAMAGMSYIQNNWDNASINVDGKDGKDILKSNEANFRYIDFLLDDATRRVGNAPGMSNSIAYFGRLTYSYDSRYSAQVNFRADAFDSSKLSKQARWGYFPSASIGWTISNENFIRDNVSRDVLSFLKLRASWGRNGNVSVLNGYQYSSTVSLNSQWYQYNPSKGDGSPTYGSAPDGLANPDLKWETSDQVDVGLDARMFSDRLTVGIDWYDKRTKDLLVQIAPVPEIGVKQTWVNGGSVLNRGLEFELGWKDHVGDFHYSINANMATLHNEVLSVHPALGRIDGTQGGVSGLNNKIRTRFEEGYPIWYFCGYKYAGVDKDGAPTYYNAAGEITTQVSDADLQYIGKSIPDFTYGITINLAYKGFDINIFGTGVAGNDIFSLLYSADRSKTNTLSYFWKNSAGNPSAKSDKFPDMKKVATDWTFWSSSASLFNGSYFKFKNIQLGYTLPQNITKKACISNLRFYVSLDDFFTITSYPGFDPETATTGNIVNYGYDAGSYPTTKKCIFGVNLTF